MGATPQGFESLPLRHLAANNRIKSRKEFSCGFSYMGGCSMLTLNLEFQEEYKRLDRLCKDYLSSAEGVSEYIRQMEATPWSNRLYVFTWEDDYKQLKHVRWVRNQLAHEVGSLNSDVCTEGDLDWVQSFYNRILNGSDPFTIIREAKAEEALRAKQQAQARKATDADHPKPPQPKPSLWDRLIADIKKFFS